MLQTSNRIYDPEGKLLAAGSSEKSVRLWRLPAAPSGLREMEHRTWAALGARLNPQGGLEAIPWYDWQPLRQEVRAWDERQQGNGPPAGVPPAAEPWWAWSDRGDGHVSRGEWNQAIASYSKAIGRGAEDGAVWANRGGACAALGQWVRATADYARAIDLAPDHPEWWHGQALAELASRDTKGYRKTCALMLDRLGAAGDPSSAHTVA